MSARFDDFSNKGQPLVIQFSVKHEQSIDCGGGYIKLFPSELNQEDMHGDSVYNIMFGKWTKGWCVKWYCFCWINRAVFATHRHSLSLCICGLVQVLIFAALAQRKFT